MTKDIKHEGEPMRGGFLKVTVRGASVDDPDALRLSEQKARAGHFDRPALPRDEVVKRLRELIQPCNE